MKIDRDRSRAWWKRFDTDDLIDAEELINFVMYHKVQASPEYTVDEKHDILSAWDKVQSAVWEKNL
jgi:hypothetical protein